MQGNHIFVAQEKSFNLQANAKTLTTIGAAKKGLKRRALRKNHNILIRDGVAEYLKIDDKELELKIQKGDIWCRVTKDINKPQITIILYIGIGKGFHQTELTPNNEFLQLIAELIRPHIYKSTQAN